MKAEVFTKRGCSTCSRAKDFLSQRGLQVVERDFFTNRLGEAELRALIGDTRPADAFAWRSPRAAHLGLDSRNPPSETELVRLMLDLPYFIKRPVIRIGGATVFGFDREKIVSLIS